MPSDVSSNAPSEAVIAVPAPFAPTVSIKNSAAAIAVAESVAVAVTVGLAFARLGETDTEEVVGPVMSGLPTITVKTPL